MRVQNRRLLHRFLRKVNKAGPIHHEHGQCWTWTAGTVTGYGTFWLEGRNQPAHKVAYELFIGKVPDDILVLHKCDNHPCVNPKHLFLGTHQDNMDDCVSKGRQAKGVDVHLTKLTESEVLEIRRTKGISQRKLAKIYGVGQYCILSILHRRTWKHI